MQDSRAEMCERETLATVGVNHPHSQHGSGGLQVKHHELIFHQFKSGQMMNGEPASEALQPSRTAAASVNAANAPCNVIITSMLQCLVARQDLALGLIIAATVHICGVETRFYCQMKLKTSKKSVIRFPCVSQDTTDPQIIGQTVLYPCLGDTGLNKNKHTANLIVRRFCLRSVDGALPFWEDSCFTSKSFCPEVFPTLNADFQPITHQPLVHDQYVIFHIHHLFFFLRYPEQACCQWAARIKDQESHQGPKRWTRWRALLIRARTPA